jgi:Tol biopolymer transport system component
MADRVPRSERSDGTGQRRLASDAPGYSDHQPKYTPDGRHIVFTRCAPDDGLCAIWIMRSNGTRPHLVIPFIESPNETNNFYPVVSPDGRRITYARFGFDGIRAQVWVARTTAGR